MSKGPMKVWRITGAINSQTAIGDSLIKKKKKKNFKN